MTTTMTTYVFSPRDLVTFRRSAPGTITGFNTGFRTREPLRLFDPEVLTQRETMLVVHVPDDNNGYDTDAVLALTSKGILWVRAPKLDPVARAAAATGDT